ncbi:toprim domain-containing protein [Dyella sp. GSA-30]|uniref:toprim domain-containing protein n=1 Tax=Dyella sp. GSA-30 TaxID=2994496 RepID=UPI0024919DE6|nr:toprim domain-containing protein [Dyella sp. GSA-30]BDU22040.1 hypothetical protein DYGSA30_34970 [Dyella sp. GSA-30]
MNLLESVVKAMRAQGMEPADIGCIRLDGVICRFDCSDDKRGRRNAWCVVFATGPRPVVSFGHWARSIRQTVVLGPGEQLTLAEREMERNARQQAMAARDAQRKHAQDRVRREAADQWQGSEPANNYHPYLIRKGIDAAGARQHGGFLLIPLRDTQGHIWNLQRIRADGAKRFLRGGRVKGLYACLGGPVAGALIICEGWATGKSLHAATELPVAVAFSAGNLLAVARAMREKYPCARIVIAGDNDIKPDGSNPGLEAAKAAAAATHALLAIPPIAGDFNDFAAQCGADTNGEANTHEQFS